MTSIQSHARRLLSAALFGALFLSACAEDETLSALKDDTEAPPPSEPEPLTVVADVDMDYEPSSTRVQLGTKADQAAFESLLIDTLNGLSE